MKWNYCEIKKRILFCGVFFIYSISGILSKLAGLAGVGSVQFFVCYVGMLLVMGIYAVLWQQLLKRYPLSDVFLYKPIVMVLGSIYGVMFFDEEISVQKIIGSLLILIGVYFVGRRAD